MSGRGELSTSDFDYHLPPESIAQTPPPERTQSRMLVLHRETGEREHRGFTDLPSYLRPGDCLVINDSRVMAARLFGTKAGGSARFEALLLAPVTDREWLAMLRPGKRARPGTVIHIEGADATCDVVERCPDGVFRLAFSTPDVPALLERCGHMPLPPYIDRPDTPEDRERYQTVYAREPGSVAAPTAGLHFTEAMLDRLAATGVRVARVTLHVGAGTFKPVATERLRDHVMHEEWFRLTPETVGTIDGARRAGGRVFAVGTTAVRVLESCLDDAGCLTPRTGATRLFLHPPYRPRLVDGLLTNFHLPKSTLLMLVCTFAERAAVLAAYRDAVARGYRFYSYGDCMLLAPGQTPDS